MLSKYKAAISFACHWIPKCIRCQLINLHFRAISMLLPSQCVVQVWFCRVLEYARRSCILAWDISFLVGMLNDKCASFLIRIDLCLKKLSASIILFSQTVFPLLACQLLRWPYGKSCLEQEWGGAECVLEMPWFWNIAAEVGWIPFPASVWMSEFRELCLPRAARGFLNTC